MLKLLQSANPFSFVFLLLYFAALNIHPVLFNAYNPIELHTPIFDWFFINVLNMDNLSPEQLFYITITIIFIQGILLSILLRAFKITSKLNLVPAAIYYLLIYLFDEFIAFTPALILNLFIPLLIAMLFGVYNQKSADTTFFNSGFLNGCMSIIYFPAAIYSLFSIYALYALRSSTVREFFVFISGFITIVFLVFTACFWYDSTDLLTTSVIIPFSKNTIPQTHFIVYIKCFLVLCFLLPAIAFVNQRSRGFLVQIRKYLYALMILAVFGAVSGFLYSYITIPAFVSAAIPFAIIIGYYLSYLKNRDTAEILHLTCMGIVFTFQYINFA
ncbi:MAG: hypothetical protein KBE86_13320 [Chitinophagales bacterium]|nr:hypothetical protein [Chitinophagales bacterium]MBP9704211.1 hypothetical protein [Chitinophagales bacterium]